MQFCKIIKFELQTLNRSFKLLFTHEIWGFQGGDDLDRGFLVSDTV